MKITIGIRILWGFLDPPPPGKPLWMVTYPITNLKMTRMASAVNILHTVVDYQHFTRILLVHGVDILSVLISSDM